MAPSSSTQKIGLLGGTFDPVHSGHKAIATSFVDSEYIEELWVVLTPSPPHKRSQSTASYRDRKNMLELAFRDNEKVFISDVESSLPEPSYTIQTITYLQKKYPLHSFYLCIGEDSLVEFTSWYQWEKILQKVSLLVAARPQVGHKPPEALPKDKINWVDHEPVDVSSTEIREKLKKENISSLPIPEKVVSYIKEKGLYQ